MLCAYSSPLRFIIFGVMTMLACQPVNADAISIRQWANDLERLESEVIAPLRAQFDQESCQAGFGGYVRAYLEQLKIIRTTVSSINYLLFREVGLSTAQSISVFNELVECGEGINKWALFEAQLKGKIEYTGNLLALLEVASH